MTAPAVNLNSRNTLGYCHPLVLWLLNVDEIRTLLNLQTFSLILNTNLNKNQTLIQLMLIFHIFNGFQTVTHFISESPSDIPFKAIDQ